MYLNQDGYTSIAHLFELVEKQNIDEYKKILFKFVCEINRLHDRNIIDRYGFDQFQNYFSNVVLSLETCIKYFRGVLKRHEVDDFAFQLMVEKLVWKSMGQHYILDSCSGFEQEEFAFRLFCLFNRFCDCNTLPLALGSRARSLIFSWLSILEPDTDFPGTFDELLEYVQVRKDPYMMVTVRQCYDQYVRDVLIEERLLINTSNLVLGNGDSYFKKDKASLKTVSLTSRMLKVYADNPISGGSHTDGDLSTISVDNKSRVNVLFQIPMYKVRTKVETRKPSLFKSTLISVISIKSCATSQCIELMFDKQKDHHSFSEWNRYIKESEDILENKINRLRHIQMSTLRHSIDKTTRRRRSRSV